MKALLLLCLILLVSPACATTQATPASSTTDSTLETTGTTYVVQRGTVTKRLEFAGRVAPVEEVPLYFKTAGYVKDVYVRQGDQVKAGDLLADLEPEFGIDSLQNQVASAELNLSLAQAGLSQAEQANAHAILQAETGLETARQELSAARALAVSHSAAITSAGVGVERAQDLLAKAQTQYQEALSKPWEREEVLEANALALREARWNYTTAQALYDQAVATEAAYGHQLRIAEIAVEQAEAELEQLKKGVDPALSIEVQRAQQQLDLLKEGARLVTPVDGEVVSLSLYPGRPVEPFVPVVVIADPSAIEVSANLTDDQLQQATEGQRATVALSTDSELTWTGTVRRLPYPYGSGGSADNPTGIDTSTRISLEGEAGGLQLGALVRVTIVLEERSDALWLPPDAIRAFQGRSFVIVQDGGRQQRLGIELGIESEDQVEVLKGLREGQVVVAP
ncbi:MAG: HlyD family efflux transporter periplasmic adaptor subunit [Anaerolineae bacterium]